MTALIDQATNCNQQLIRTMPLIFLTLDTSQSNIDRSNIVARANYMKSTRESIACLPLVQKKKNPQTRTRTMRLMSSTLETSHSSIVPFMAAQSSNILLMLVTADVFHPSKSSSF